MSGSHHFEISFPIIFHDFRLICDSRQTKPSFFPSHFPSLSVDATHFHRPLGPLPLPITLQREPPSQEPDLRNLLLSSRRHLLHLAITSSPPVMSIPSGLIQSNHGEPQSIPAGEDRQSHAAKSKQFHITSEVQCHMLEPDGPSPLASPCSIRPPPCFLHPSSCMLAATPRPRKRR